MQPCSRTAYAPDRNDFVADAYAGLTHDASDTLPSFADGLRAAHLTAAVVESARTGARVAVREAASARVPEGAVAV